MKYKVTEEDILLVEDFIQRAANNHFAFSRDYQEITENIRIGKLGEIAYKAYAGDEVGGVDWSGIPQGTSPDFFRKDGRGIQVKTLNHDTRWCSFYNWDFDELAVLRINSRVNEIRLIGVFERQFIKSIASKSKWRGWYIDPEKC